MQNKQRKELIQLQKAYEQGVLDEATYRAAVAALQGAGSMHANVSGSGAVAQSGGVATGAGGVAIGGNLIMVSSLSDLDDLAPRVRGELEQALRQQLRSSTENAAHHLALGLHYLDLGLYGDAVNALKTAQSIEPHNAKVLYYLALAGLKGRRPRSLRLFEIENVERYLAASVRLDAGRAESLYLWALVKYDFYVAGGMRVSPPDVDDLLDMAEAAQYDADEIEHLLEHVPVPASPVTDAMQDR